MARPPRAVSNVLFSPALVAWSLLQGVVAFVPLATLYVFALRWGLPEGDARALTFASLVLVNLSLVIVNRSFDTSLTGMIGKRNRVLWSVSMVAVALLALVLAWPTGRELFRFGRLHADDLGLVATIVVGVFAVLEALKLVMRSRLAA